MAVILTLSMALPTQLTNVIMSLRTPDHCVNAVELDLQQDCSSYLATMWLRLPLENNDEYRYRCPRKTRC